MLNQDNRTNKILSVIYEMFPDARCELNYSNIFELSVATILSAQTTDKSVNKVTPVLFLKYPTPNDLSKANENDVLISDMVPAQHNDGRRGMYCKVRDLFIPISYV